MSKVIQNKGGIGMGAPYDIPGYEYDPVTDKFKDLATGTTFDKDGNAKLENSKSVSITENGEYQINPSATYDAMKKVALSVEVEGTADLEDNKAATIDVSAYTDPVEVTPTQGKDGMKKVTVTLDNIPQIEANKAQTIDVSQYTEPVEITPTSGKDGMAKATVTLSNIPSPSGATTLYAWRDTDTNTIYLPTSVAPSAKADVVYIEDGIIQIGIGSLNTELHSRIETLSAEDTYTKISDTEFIMSWYGNEKTFTRYSDGDVTLSVW